MEKEKRQEPEALPDETLDEASGGILPYVEQDAKSITDGTSNTKAGFAGDGLGSSHTGGVNLTKTGLPVLVDLPIIGRLFGVTNRTETKRDLLILITPHIIDEGTTPDSGRP